MTIRHISDVICDRKPITLNASQSVKSACCRMRESGVGAILATDAQNKLIGIFTGRDAIARVLAEGLDPAKTPISAVMTKAPKTLSPEMTAVDALHLMYDGGFRHVPIATGDKIVGLVSRGDFRGVERARLEDEVEIWETI